MKRLTSSAKPIIDIFFTEEATIESIFTWVKYKVLFDEENIFKLNEQHSCSTTLGEGNSILICGDEDYVELELEEITPIF